jgi:uncharacterized protein (DUF2345 family)
MLDDEELKRVDHATEPVGDVDADSAERVLALADATTTVALSAGRRLEVTRGAEDIVSVYAPSGRVEVSIRMTDEGPVLSVSAAALQLRARGALDIDCERLRVRARDGIALEARGSLRQEAGGDVVVQAAGALVAEGSRVGVAARDGDVQIEGDGDVWIDGRRVLLNS